MDAKTTKTGIFYVGLLGYVANVFAVTVALAAPIFHIDPNVDDLN